MTTVWAQGDYPRLAREVLAGLGPRLVEACGVGPGDRVLDVAAGSGVTARAAARAGASVVAADVTQELLDAGRAQEPDIEWVLADAQELPFDDGEFDVVLSSIGAMFAPAHDKTAVELTRVCRSGGRLGMINWTPEGSIGDFFAVFAPYGPPAAGPAPTLWGTEDHVRTLFGDRVTALSATHDALPVDRFASPVEYRDYYRANFGPVVATYAALDDDGRAALDRDFLAYAERFFRDGRYFYEYLLVVATRR